MKSDFEQLAKAQALLAQALGCARNAMTNNPNVIEAKGHMRHAMDKLSNHAKKTQMRKQNVETEHEKWWGHVNAGAKEAPMANVSAEAYNRTLSQLNMMIEGEKRKIDQIEQNVKQNIQQNAKPGLMND